MYVLSSGSLISFVLVGGGGRAGRLSSFMHLLPTPHSMGPETSLVGSCAENHLCTCDLYNPVHTVLDAFISITWASGRGLGPGNLEFFGPQMALAYRLDVISAQKTLDPGANPLPLAFVMDMHTSKTLCTGLYKS
jgi:hypothetical protein